MCNLQSPINLCCMSLDCGGNQSIQWKGRTCRFHTERPPGSAGTQTGDLLAVRRHHAMHSSKYVNSKDLLNTAATSINIAWHFHPSIHLPIHFHTEETQTTTRRTSKLHTEQLPGSAVTWTRDPLAVQRQCYSPSHPSYFFLLINMQMYPFLVSSITPQKDLDYSELLTATSVLSHKVLNQLQNLTNTLLIHHITLHQFTTH